LHLTARTSTKRVSSFLGNCLPTRPTLVRNWFFCVVRPKVGASSISYLVQLVVVAAASQAAVRQTQYPLPSRCQQSRNFRRRTQPRAQERRGSQVAPGEGRQPVVGVAAAVGAAAEWPVELAAAASAEPHAQPAAVAAVGELPGALQAMQSHPAGGGRWQETYRGLRKPVRWM